MDKGSETTTLQVGAAVYSLSFKTLCEIWQRHTCSPQLTRFPCAPFPHSKKSYKAVCTDGEGRKSKHVPTGNAYSLHGQQKMAQHVCGQRRETCVEYTLTEHSKKTAASKGNETARGLADVWGCSFCSFCLSGLKQARGTRRAAFTRGKQNARHVSGP